MKVLVAQLGARRHYAAPRALAANGLLEACVTDLCADAPPLSWLRALTPAPLKRGALGRVLGRRAIGVPPERIHNLIRFALPARFTAHKGALQTDVWAERNSAFARAVAARGFGDACAVYAFNGAALEIFQAAKPKGLRCILDQTAAPWRFNSTLLQAETRRWPNWEAKPAEIDLSGRLSAREEAEWRLADVIICGSQFAADALAVTGGPKEKCTVLAYEGHTPAPPRDWRSPRPSHAQRKLRALTVGSVQLRKGAPYLLEAARRLKDDFEFRWVGPNLLSDEASSKMREYVALPGPAPRAEIWRHYAWADVFVLPTLSEGAANAVLEAHAARLPIVTTKNAGALEQGRSDVVHVPVQDSEALYSALVKVAVEIASGSADREASEQAHCSFPVYSEKLSALLLADPRLNVASMVGGESVA